MDGINPAALLLITVAILAVIIGVTGTQDAVFKALTGHAVTSSSTNTNLPTAPGVGTPIDPYPAGGKVLLSPTGAYQGFEQSA